MKKNHVTAGAALLTMMLLLTGCGGTLPEMTPEQEDAIGEYAAVMLLKYDVNKRSRLVDLSTVETMTSAQETPIVTPAPAPEGMRPVDNTPVVELNSQPADNKAAGMEEFFDFPAGVTITYQGSYTCQSYPDTAGKTDCLGLDAVEGKRLLVLEFDISNQTQTDAEINILNQKSSYKITVNGEATRDALITLLMNDLSTYMDTVKAGENVSTVLLVEMEQEILDSVSNISLHLKNEAKTYTIQLQ